MNGKRMALRLPGYNFLYSKVSLQKHLPQIWNEPCAVIVLPGLRFYSRPNFGAVRLKKKVQRLNENTFFASQDYREGQHKLKILQRNERVCSFGSYNGVGFFAMSCMYRPVTDGSQWDCSRRLSWYCMTVYLNTHITFSWSSSVWRLERKR